MTGRGGLRSSGGASELGPWHAGMVVFGCVPAFSGGQPEGRRHATHRGVHGPRRGRPVPRRGTGASHTTRAGVIAAMTSTSDQAATNTLMNGDRAREAAGRGVVLRRRHRRWTVPGEPRRERRRRADGHATQQKGGGSRVLPPGRGTGAPPWQGYRGGPHQDGSLAPARRWGRARLAPRPRWTLRRPAPGRPASGSSGTHPRTRSPRAVP